MNKPFAVLPLGLATLALTSHSVLSAGFQLQERSARGLGRAFSGEAAIADDASVLASNVAGIIKLDDNSVSVGLSYINPHVDVDGTIAGGAAPANDNDIGDEAIVPYFYYTKKITDNLSAGIGLFTTYGLATDYSSNFNGLAGADKSELKSFNINPSLAYRINKQWSIGAGFNALYADGDITGTAGPLGAGPLPSGTNLLNLEGDDWGFGYNIGILFEPSESTRFGLHYRSAIDLSLEGEASGFAATGAPTGDIDATLDVTLPETLEFSVYHELNDKWAIHGDIVWTRWSRFQSLVPQRIDGSEIENVEEDWDDAFRYSIGATYKYSDRLTLRAGLAFDESPVPGRTRTLRIPDEDRFWVSIGASYAINECYTVDFGYTHIFVNDASISGTSQPSNQGFEGEASGDIDLVAIGISGSF